MNIGIVGVPQVGKSTLFRLLTNLNESARRRVPIGVAKVPDSRVEYLAGLYQPRKTTYAHINVTDTPGLRPGQSAEFLSSLKDTDALVAVVRAFPEPSVPTEHLQGLDPLAEVQAVEAELAITDWALLDKRLERLRKTRVKQNEQTIEVLERVAAALENGESLRRQYLSADDRQELQGMSFFSDKPLIVVVNTDEEQLKSRSFPGKEALEQWCVSHDVIMLEVCAQLEAEIGELDAIDRQVFLQDLGLTEPGLARLAKAAYVHLGLISFFTVGEDEVRAWTIVKDCTARKAAGKIHSDIERGFIRAQVISYEDFASRNGEHLRENGLLRLEGSDYVVQDGDIIEFRFHV